jgi:dihydrolipoamide dehydrogenase
MKMIAMRIFKYGYYLNGALFMQINVVTQRGFVPVDEQMQVMDADGSVVC